MIKIDQETINLLIGAGISLFSSLLTIAVTAFIQYKKDDKEKRGLIFLQRINQLEDFSKEIAMFLSEISMKFGSTYLVNDKKENIIYTSEVNDRFKKYSPQLAYYSAISKYLGGDVNKSFFQLIQNLQNTRDFILQLYILLLQDDDTVVEWENKLDHYIDRLDVDNYTKLLMAFDKLKANSPKI
jgi:hypothetical protein